MKKLFYIIAILFVTALSFSSCTEESITPKSDLQNAGGNGSLDPIKA